MSEHLGKKRVDASSGLQSLAFLSLSLSLSLSIYIYIHTLALVLLSGPSFLLISVFVGHLLLSAGVMRFMQIFPDRMSLKYPFYMLISSPIMLSNMLGPDSNIYLDQILNDKIWPLLAICSVHCLARNHYWYSGFTKHGIFSTRQKIGPLFASKSALAKIDFGISVAFLVLAVFLT